MVYMNFFVLRVCPAQCKANALPLHRLFLVSCVQKRIDDLESFYIAHVEDERSVLFEKQRLRLRKLLAEYDGATLGAGA